LQALELIKYAMKCEINVNFDSYTCCPSGQWSSLILLHIHKNIYIYRPHTSTWRHDARCPAPQGVAERTGLCRGEEEGLATPTPGSPRLNPCWGWGGMHPGFRRMEDVTMWLMMILVVY